MYRILKTSSDGSNKHWVNDPEGIAMEFSTFNEAKEIKDLFESNTTHGSIYTIYPLSANV